MKVYVITITDEDGYSFIPAIYADKNKAANRIIEIRTNIIEDEYSMLDNWVDMLEYEVEE